MSGVDWINVMLVLIWAVVAILGLIKIMIYENKKRGDKDDKNV